MNQRDFVIVLGWSFYIQVLIGMIDMTLNRPAYALPFNSGWILILGLSCIVSGLLTIISALENRK